MPMIYCTMRRYISRALVCSPCVPVATSDADQRREALSKTTFGKAHFGDDLWRVIGRRNPFDSRV